MSKQKPGWRELSRGAIPYKSSEEYETGDWGVEYPKIDKGRCTKCTLCHFFCPEGAIKVFENGNIEVDLTHCKGCGICAEECPVNCIEMIRKR
jgi:2-oxoacid:acceptor oxidoreductase delta subunit (pyruvate/2-ketoisovalerate family)